MSNVKIGDVYASSWGYDQTNVDFYQITKIVTDKTIEATEIGSERIEGHPDRVIPVIDNFIGKPFRKRLTKYLTIKINNYASASLWDGQPKYCTPFGEGH